ncbi:MAG TPA: hypothetical protein VM638_06425 [Actinomycetota bacterium]|nr:hypothetical protein [Actinomycetota bacterium]
MSEQGRIWEAEWGPLGVVEGHDDVEGVLRWAVASDPVHVAVHRIEGLGDDPPAYTSPHRHQDEELNLILGEDLVYEIRIGEDTSLVRAPGAVWVPSGVPHAANARGGRGHLICIRFTPGERPARGTR